MTAHAIFVPLKPVIMTSNGPSRERLHEVQMPLALLPNGTATEPGGECERDADQHCGHLAVHLNGPAGKPLPRGLKKRTGAARSLFAWPRAQGKQEVDEAVPRNVFDSVINGIDKKEA